MPRKTTIHNKPPIGKLIGNQLLELKKEQKWLSEQTKISQTYMCAIINGRAIPTIKTLKKIGRCLNIDIKTLINTLINES